MNKYAPIVIFCYRRPKHLSRMLESLALCDGFDQSPVVVYGDGPKNSSEEALVREAREVAIKKLGARAEYFFSDINIGLAASITMGVSEVLDRFGRAIILEDDLELHPYFLRFMNRALDAYAENKEVFQVSGYMFDVPELAVDSHAVFLPFTTSWGWATWKRAWQQMDFEAMGWQELCKDKKLRKSFDLDGAYGYSSMLERQMHGLIDSWAIRWYWTVFKSKGLVVYPPTTLVKNGGFDGSGSHGRGVLRKFSKILPATHCYVECNLPTDIEYRGGVFHLVLKAFRRQNGGAVAVLLNRLRLIFSAKRI